MKHSVRSLDLSSFDSNHSFYVFCRTLEVLSSTNNHSGIAGRFQHIILSSTVYSSSYSITHIVSKSPGEVSRQKALNLLHKQQGNHTQAHALDTHKMFGDNNDFDMFAPLDNNFTQQQQHNDINDDKLELDNDPFNSNHPTIMVEPSQDPTVDSFNTTTNSTTSSSSLSFPMSDYNPSQQQQQQQQQSTGMPATTEDFSGDSSQSFAAQYWPNDTNSQVPTISQPSQHLQMGDFDNARDTLSVSASPLSTVNLASSPQLSSMRALGRANSFTSVHSAASSTGLSGVFDSQLDMSDKFRTSLRPSTSSSLTDSLSDLHSSPASFADDAALFNDDSSSPTESKAPSSAGPHRKARFKCSPEQLEQLHAFFAANRNPTGKVRRELATRIGMPERSVQIWFQNRRAKLKQRGEVCCTSSSMPAPAMKRSGSAPKMSKTASASTLTAGQPAASGMARSSSASLASGSGRLPNARKAMKASKALSSHESVNLIPTVSICIGTWRRVRPLTCFFSRNHRLFGWTMRSDSVGFKMECPYSSVREITFNGPISPSMSELAEQICEPLGLLYIRLQRPPMFNMQTFKSASRPGEREPTGTTWRQCEDFTEGRQGTMVLSHILSGPFQALREVVLKLRASDDDIASKLYMNDDITLQQSQQVYPQQQQSGGAVMTGNWVSSSEEEEDHHPQLRLDHNYFESISDQHRFPPSMQMYPGPSPHIAVMPPSADYQQANAYSEMSEGESQSGHDQHLNFPRMSVQSHHSAPSSFQINNAGGDIMRNFSSGNLHQDVTGYDVLHGLGLSGVEGIHPHDQQQQDGTNANWFQPGHLSAPAAPQSSFVNLPWQSSPSQPQPLDEQQPQPL